MLDCGVSSPTRFAIIWSTLIPEWMEEDDAALLTDACPTGYQAAEMGEIKENDTVVVFGAGPIGLFAAKFAWFFGAGALVLIVFWIGTRASTRSESS
jgi:threonine dehydrogenase-like Zn-dependent dehydrogenase